MNGDPVQNAFVHFEKKSSLFETHPVFELFKFSKGDGANVVSGEGVKMNHPVKTIQKLKPECFGKPVIHLPVHCRQISLRIKSNGLPAVHFGSGIGSHNYDHRAAGYGFSGTVYEGPLIDQLQKPIMNLGMRLFKLIEE